MHLVIFSKNCLADKGPECGHMSGYRELFTSGVEGACVTDMAGRREGTELVWLRNFLALILLRMRPAFMCPPVDGHRQHAIWLYFYSQTKTTNSGYL